MTCARTPRLQWASSDLQKIPYVIGRILEEDKVMITVLPRAPAAALLESLGLIIYVICGCLEGSREALEIEL